MNSIILRRCLLIVGLFLILEGCSNNRTVEDLSVKLQSKKPNKRYKAAKALRQLGPGAKQALPELVQSLSDPSAKVRAAAATAIGRMGSVAEEAAPGLRQ